MLTSDSEQVVPVALRERPQWLTWRFEQGDKDKKPRKVPYYAGGGRRYGDQGTEEDRAALVPFDAAVRAMESRKCDGIGFAFLPGDGLIGIDLDNAIDADTGELHENARAIIDACESFAEVSPSGRGVHIYVTYPHQTKEDTEGISGRANDIGAGVGLEMYCGRQFFTVSGRHWTGSPTEVRDLPEPVMRRIKATIEQAKAKRRGDRPAQARPAPPATTDQANERVLIESALAVLSADLAYNDWLGVGMAIYDRLGETAFAVWDYWSSKGSGYPGSDTLQTHWRSFGGSRTPGTAGVIFSLAKAAGWRAPRAAKPPKAQPPVTPPPAQQDDGGGGDEPPPYDAPASDLPEPDDHDWMNRFRRNEKSSITSTLHNTLLVLEHDEPWRKVIAFDQFAHRIVKLRPPPKGKAGEWADIDDVNAMVYISRTFGFEPKKPTVMDAVMAAAHARAFHPLRNYLESLEWDGVRRVDRAFARYWGALSTPDTASLDGGERLRHGVYLRLAAMKWFVGAVARVMRPGCKLDTMVVFEGGQGAKKSSSLRSLFGDQFFADSKLVLGDKDALAQMIGKWAYEMAEMDAFSKAEDNLFKLFMSTQHDRVRWHYGKRAEDVPRQGIFIGTTNQGQYGKDPTGMRRVWPLMVGVIDIEALKADRDQLWAEALHWYREGVRWWVDRDKIVLDPGQDTRLAPYLDRPWDEWDLFKEQADKRQIWDAWADPILDYLEERNAEPWFTTAALLEHALKLDKSRWSRPEQMRVGAIMRQLGWDNHKAGPKHKRVNAWYRPEPAQAVSGVADQVVSDDDFVPF